MGEIWYFGVFDQIADKVFQQNILDRCILDKKVDLNIYLPSYSNVKDHWRKHKVQWGNIGEIQFFAILTNLQVESFNQTYRIDVFWMEKVIYIYINTFRLGT